MAKKRKKSVQQKSAFSPYRYIKEKARNFPIEKCLFTDAWEETGLCQILVARKQPSGLYLFGFYLLDTWCLGIKNTLYNINYSKEELEDFIDTVNRSSDAPFESCDYVYAHNLIYGAQEYAEELGFTPNSDFSTSKYILEEDSEDIELIEFEFGKDGKPFFVAGPDDDVRRVQRILHNSAGPGNYNY